MKPSKTPYIEFHYVCFILTQYEQLFIYVLFSTFLANSSAQPV